MAVGEKAAPFRLQILSDVHLEMREGKLPAVPATAPFLALLGDIGYPHVGGDYQRFLLHLADRPAPASSSDVAPEERGWDRIFVLAGNHEYYKGHYEKVKPIIAGVCAMRPDKLMFLDRTAVRLDKEGVWLLGCTLWTHIPESEGAEASRMVNDYYNIKLSVDDTNAFHEEELNWIKEQVDRITAQHGDDRIVVLTHHAPTPNSVNPAHHCLDASAFTDLEAYIKAHTPPIAAWAYGHTHWCSRTTLEGERGGPGCQVVSNAMGYPRETIPHFDITYALALPSS
ncbi:Ser/Thr phosphatase family superfamily protein [Acanthamoeba castellanii str. Neff]|uniref:Ser/Thr phosphatase family superfamily protein n=1 Tax=Acanthamoeba castellanii (strain ATCC 30010 / Neff) TaxID=1257118 RepID=L8GX02_ACACF|nr:Ser/Thr phosphatase family superfamily protein [Acanthamoeba castellanii str. Neff]ELR17492.1 Ser/Thr phosphatase family superfamily protein [Acanthamoeba castellanii str. Neff]